MGSVSSWNTTGPRLTDTKGRPPRQHSIMSALRGSGRAFVNLAASLPGRLTPPVNLCMCIFDTNYSATMPTRPGLAKDFTHARFAEPPTPR